MTPATSDFMRLRNTGSIVAILRSLGTRRRKLAVLAVRQRLMRNIAQRDADAVEAAR